MCTALHVVVYLFSVLIVACGELMSASNPGLIRDGRGVHQRGAILRGRLFVRTHVGSSLRLRGGFDAVPLHEFEALLDCLQRPDATPQQRQHAQQFALSLQNPVDLSEVPPQGDPASRRQAALTKRLSQLQHILDCSQSPTAQVSEMHMRGKKPSAFHPFPCLGHAGQQWHQTSTSVIPIRIIRDRST